MMSFWVSVRPTGKDECPLYGQRACHEETILGIRGDNCRNGELGDLYGSYLYI